MATQFNVALSVGRVPTSTPGFNSVRATSQWSAGGEKYNVSMRDFGGAKHYRLQNERGDRGMSFSVNNRTGYVSNLRSNNMGYADRNALISKAQGRFAPAMKASAPTRPFYGPAYNGTRAQLNTIRADIRRLTNLIESYFPKPDSRPTQVQPNKTQYDALYQQIQALTRQVAELTQRTQPKTEPETTKPSPETTATQQQLVQMQQQLNTLQKALETLMANMGRAPVVPGSTPAPTTTQPGTPKVVNPEPLPTNPQPTPQPVDKSPTATA
jgi:hypothetical protein